MKKLNVALFILFLFSLASCAPFQGPGQYRPGSGGYSGGFANEKKVELRGSENIRFYWPVSIPIVNQPYSPKHNADHEGIDIGGHKGTPIFSAAPGRVIYTGRDFKGYGLMVIVEHNEEWATLYGHFSKIKTKTGQYVEQGQTIGLMGRTGRATGVHLHFEILRNKQPVDPMLYLPEHN